MSNDVLRHIQDHDLNALREIYGTEEWLWALRIDLDICYLETKRQATAKEGRNE